MQLNSKSCEIPSLRLLSFSASKGRNSSPLPGLQVLLGPWKHNTWRRYGRTAGRCKATIYQGLVSPQHLETTDTETSLVPRLPFVELNIHHTWGQLPPAQALTLFHVLWAPCAKIEAARYSVFISFGARLVPPRERGWFVAVKPMKVRMRNNPCRWPASVPHLSLCIESCLGWERLCSLQSLLSLHLTQVTHFSTHSLLHLLEDSVNILCTPSAPTSDCAPIIIRLPPGTVWIL